jgi:hypothetical protein
MNNQDYDKQIEVLNSTLWEHRALRPKIDKWLTNFKTDQDREYALYLLSRLMYFSSSNIRNLLKALYRDLYRYPVIEKIRKDNGNTLDEYLIESEFKKVLHCTRFLGVGNPSESGVHLLYYFRQENKIPKSLFVNTDDVIKRHSDGSITLRSDFNTATRFVFIDDLCGSGSQATTDTNVRRCVDDIRKLKPNAHISYLMLFGLSQGVEVVRNSKLYDYAQAVVELDESYKCFSDKSRFFNDAHHDKAIARDVAYRYGYNLIRAYSQSCGYSPLEQDDIAKAHALGFGDCQLLISMHHNTPDNTLPIIWFDEIEGFWNPIFKRYNKVY